MATIKVNRLEAKKKRGEKIRVIIYARVSTDDQEDYGTSLETQVKDCIEYCELNGHIVVDVIQETWSGFDLDKRKKVQEAMKRCRDGEADAMLFRTYDRATRNYTHFAVMHHDSTRYAYGLLCVKETFDPTNIIEVMMRNLVIMFAEMERLNIRDRTDLGRRQRARNGRLISGKRPKYGYKYGHTQVLDKQIRNTHNVIDKYEAHVIHVIDAWYLEGYSHRAIAIKLNDLHIPSATGKKWSRQIIHVILNSTEYHGEGYAFKYDTVENELGKKHLVLKPVEDRIPMPASLYPVIRKKATYDAIQIRLKTAHTSGRSSTRTAEDTLLTGGYIRCGICGRSMASSKVRGSIAYYCNGDNNERYNHSINIRAHKIERAVLDYVNILLQDMHIIEVALVEYIGTHTAQVSTDSYEHAIEETKKQQEELAIDLKQTRGNGRQLLLKQMSELENELERLQQYKQSVMGDGNRWEVIKRDVDSLLEWLHTSTTDIYEAPYDVQVRILRTLGIRAYVYSTDDKEHTRHEVKVTLPQLVPMLPISS